MQIYMERVVGSSSFEKLSMLESIVDILQGLPSWAIIVMTFLIAYVENLVPPSPSDVLLVFIGSLIGMGLVDMPTLLMSASLGSVIGFSTAYLLGRRYGESIADSPWVPFITHDLLARVKALFDKYHGLIIVSNRFLAGTRAVVAFAAGVARLPLPRTIAYSAVSATLWNALLLWLGERVGERWRDVEQYLSAYGWAITAIIVIVVAVLIIRRRRAQRAH